MFSQLNINGQSASFNVIDYFLLPALIIDKKLNIIYKNILWEELLEDNSAENVNEVLNSESVQKLEGFIKNSFFKKDSLVDDSVSLLKSKDSSTSYSMLIYYYPVSSKDYFILSFKASTFDLFPSKSKKYNEINFLADDDKTNTFIPIELRELFNSISDITPLSLVNKNKIKKLLDERNEIIWLKDSDENIIVANQNYVTLTGFKELDLQKKSEDYFFFPYQKDLLKSLTEYSKIIRKPILVNGIKYSSNLVQNFPLIIYPIVDNQGKTYNFFFVLSREFSEVDKRLDIHPGIKEFPLPFLRVDKSFNIIDSSKTFNDLFDIKKLSDISNLNEFLSNEVIQKIEEVLSSSKKHKFIYINNKFENSTLENSEFILRVFVNNVDGYDLLFYPFNQHEDIKLILSQRGKMLDYYIQNSPEPIFIFDKENLKFLEINQAALNLYGFSKDEFLKLDLTDLYSPEDFQSLIESLKRSNEQKTTPVFKQKTKSGRDIFVQLTYNDFKYNDLDSYFVIVKDLTKNIQLENENKLYEKIIENTSDIVIETDSFGFIKSFNQNALSILGYDQNSFTDKSFSSLIEDDQRGVVNSRLFNRKAEQISSLSTLIKKANGEFIESSIISIPIKNFNDELNSFKLIISVKEKLKESTSEVREIIKEVIVEKPVYSSESSINHNYISSDFLSGVFHEILTPLNVIFGFTQEIVEGLEKPTPEQKEAADIISQNRIKLLDTMNSVVEYSELITNSTQLNISEFRLVEIIDKLEKQAIQIANTFGIQFTLGKISSSLKVENDAEKLERVIIGLIKIVCRLSQEKKIYLSSYALDQELFLISVSDQYNSSTNYLTNSLNKIFNLNVDPREVSAPRLTVHLTKHFMNLMKMKFVDKIKINDKIESGFFLPIKLSKTEAIEQILEPSVEKEKIQEKEFVVTEIPEDTTAQLKEIHLENNSNLQEEETPKPKIDLSNLTCLYIEDQIDSQVLFKVQLKELKEIVVAPSFEEALPHLESRKFDFIVIDINLEGEYNGLDALKMIRKIHGYEKIPIFASTAYILPGNKERFIAAGFNSFIDKPIFKDRIIESLSKILFN